MASSKSSSSFPPYQPSSSARQVKRVQCPALCGQTNAEQQMATCKDLKTIAKARLRSAVILIDAGDWDGAAYMMGYVLECALKAAVCKSLRLTDYPQNRKTDTHFLTHNFDQLVVLSGVSDLFDSNASSSVFQNWSDFTKEFLGDWPAMRYNIQHQQTFTEIKVRDLYTNLTDKPDGILAVITRKKRW
ncbi:HEPN domain-containing protein [Candidatus Kaiserbacteria bacterium]|nr:HEPN domain-containing protein [Candidatus Kaiserbacteria bacterium]